MSCSMTPSHVMVCATERPARPRRSASDRSPASLLIAEASAIASGSQMNPLMPSRTNSSGPPESVAVITGLAARNASIVTYP